MNVYDEFTKLKKAIVGKTFDLENKTYNDLIIKNYNEKIKNKYFSEKENLKKIFKNGKNAYLNIFSAFKKLTNKQILSLKTIHDQTNEDLDRLADILSLHEVEVVRPNINYSIEQGFAHPMQPRDTIGKIGSKIFEIFTNNNGRLLENTCYRKIIIEEFDKGANVISSPFFYSQETENEIIIDYEKINSIDSQKIIEKNEIILEAAALYKCGKHIFYSQTKKLNRKEHSKICINENGLKWIKKQFPDFIFVPINGYGHIDGKFSILKPGLVLTWDKKYIPHIILDEKWDVLLIEDRPKYENNKIKDFLIKLGIEKYPWHHLLGICQETRFDANCLSIDEKTIITAGYDKNLSSKLKKYNIELIPWFNRWNCLWSGGPHCCTLDLFRKGNLENYFL